MANSTAKAQPKVYHAKGKDDWGTTQGLFDVLNEEFGFDLDVCANDLNAKCPNYLTEEMDALSIDWWGRCFMNPPHSQTELFLTYMAKMLVEEKIQLGVAVVASRTDTAAHHMASCFAGEIRYLKGRLSYEVFPTDWQRGACAGIQGVLIEPGAWPGLVKEIGLPQTAILALMKDPTIPGGDPKLAQSAPFPSLVYIFDRRPEQRTVYWDWKTKQRTVYVYTGYNHGPKKAPGAPWLQVAGHKSGKLTAAKQAFKDWVTKPKQTEIYHALVNDLATPEGPKPTPVFTMPPDAPKLFFMDPEGLKQIEGWELPKLLGKHDDFMHTAVEGLTGDGAAHVPKAIDWSLDAPGMGVPKPEPPVITELATMELLLTDEEETDGT